MKYAMDYLKTALTALMLALPLASAGARAQQEPPAPPPAQEAASDPAAKPAPPAKRKPVKRRSVQQVIEPTPPIVTEGYRPTLVIRPPAALPAPVPPPVQINSCDAGGCTDTNGVRYNGGVGNALIGPRGQLCTRGGVNVQCF
jgi:hypothetical protein